MWLHCIQKGNSSDIHNVIKYLTVRLSGVNTATQVCTRCAFVLKNIQNCVDLNACKQLFVLSISIYQPYCPVVGRRPQHVVSKFAYLVLFSARWFHSNTLPNRLSIFLLVFLVISSFRMVSRW